jgi:hypothetical protein
MSRPSSIGGYGPEFVSNDVQIQLLKGQGKAQGQSGGGRARGLKEQKEHTWGAFGTGPVTAVLARALFAFGTPPAALAPALQLERSAGLRLHIRLSGRERDRDRGTTAAKPTPPLVRELVCRSMATPGPVGVAPGPKAYTASVPVRLLYLCIPRGPEAARGRYGARARYGARPSLVRCTAQSSVLAGQRCWGRSHDGTKCLLQLTTGKRQG